MLIGAALIVAAGLFIIWRERQLGIQRAGGAQGDDAAGVRRMLIYKIFRAGEWAELEAAGETPGAPVDRADGYVHFSTAAQLAGTLARHFAGERGLWLLARRRRGRRRRRCAGSRRAAARSSRTSTGRSRRADVLWARPLDDGGRSRGLA